MMVARQGLTTLNGEFRSFRHDTSTKILCIFAIATAPFLSLISSSHLMPDDGIFVSVSPVWTLLAALKHDTGIIVLVHVHITDIFLIIVIIDVVLAIITSHLFKPFIYFTSMENDTTFPVLL